MFSFSKAKLFLPLALLVAQSATATRVSGRCSLGYYASQERFANSLATGSDKNDFQTLSGRLYLRLDEVGASKYEIITDIRDKHDFFDKLNRELYQLESHNDFQVRQLSIRPPYTPGQKVGWQLGRFPVTDAGSAFVDGGKLDFSFLPGFRVGTFAGLNPRQEGRSYLKFDSKASIFGVTSILEGKSRVWSKSLYLANSLVEQNYDGHLDRRYIFHNLIYQWQVDSRLITLVYYDLVPRSYMQSGLFIWQQRWAKLLESEVSHTAIDTIEYSRRQGVLERLPSSPYREESVKVTLKSEDRSRRFQLRADSGRRAADGLTRQTFEGAIVLSRILGPNWDGYLAGGSRKNFTSDDILGRFGIGYYSRLWELNIDSSYEIRKNHDVSLTGNRGTTHPMLVDSTLAYYLSKTLYVSGSLQHARDEDVTIWTGFLRLAYRFGDRESPPIRDGTPPRGAL